MESNNRKFAIISVDVNDGDIESHTIEVTEEQALVLGRVAKAIKEFKPYKRTVEDGTLVSSYSLEVTHDNNFPTGEMVREDMGQKSAKDYYKDIISPDDFEEFLELVPWTECGFHTVTGIRILAVIGDIKLI